MTDEVAGVEFAGLENDGLKTSSSAMAERPRELDQRFQMGGSI